MDKLGIYIPTHNRTNTLETTIKNFIPQVVKYRLPIYIADSSESNETKMLVFKMRKRYRKIFYKKNTPQEGKTYATALKSVLMMGKTEFVWFFGDDDVVKPGAIKTIIKNLNYYDFLQINIQLWNNTMQKKTADKKVSLDHNIIYKKNEHEKVLITSKGDYAGFMGQIITKREYLSAALENIPKSDQETSDFLHTALFFNAIVGKKGKFLSTPLINYRTGAGLEGREFAVWIINFPSVFKLLRVYSPCTIKLAGRISTYGLLVTAIQYRITHCNKQESNKYISYMWNSKTYKTSEKLAVIVILKAPRVILSLLFYSISKLKRAVTQVRVES